MNEHQIIFKVFGQWWQMNVQALRGVEVTNSGPIGIPPNFPVTMTYACDVVYDATAKTMLKNRFGDSTLNDAIVLKMWLEGGLPVFKWSGANDFRKSVNKYYKKLAGR